MGSWGRMCCDFFPGWGGVVGFVLVCLKSDDTNLSGVGMVCGVWDGRLGLSFVYFHFFFKAPAHMVASLM